MTLEDLIKQIKINSRLKFKNDNNIYYNKNLSVDKKNIFVTLNGLQTYRKSLKNLIQVDNHKLLNEMKKNLNFEKKDNLKETIKKIIKEQGIKKTENEIEIIDNALKSWEELKKKATKSEDKEHANRWIKFFENEKKKYQEKKTLKEEPNKLKPKLKEVNIIDEEGWFISGWFDVEGLVWGEKNGKEQWISPSGDGTYLIYANKQDALLKASEAATQPAKYNKKDILPGGKIYNVDEPKGEEPEEEDILIQKYKGPYDNPPEKTKWIGLKGVNVTAKPKMPVKWDLTNTKTGERSKGQGLYEKIIKKLKESNNPKKIKLGYKIIIDNVVKKLVLGITLKNGEKFFADTAKGLSLSEKLNGWDLENIRSCYVHLDSSTGEDIDINRIQPTNIKGILPKRFIWNIERDLKFLSNKEALEYEKCLKSWGVKSKIKEVKESKTSCSCGCGSCGH